MEERQDLISRQVAIDALRDAENHAFNSFYKGLAKAHKIIADLPSAQPDHVADISKKVEEDCISRQAAIDAIDKRVQFLKGDPVFRRKHGDIDLYGIKPIIRALPSAQPEIIRCKDCIVHGVCRFEQGLGLDGYCSQAERRNDG